MGFLGFFFFFESFFVWRESFATQFVPLAISNVNLFKCAIGRGPPCDFSWEAALQESSVPRSAVVGDMVPRPPFSYDFQGLFGA